MLRYEIKAGRCQSAVPSACGSSAIVQLNSASFNPYVPSVKMTVHSSYSLEDILPDAKLSASHAPSKLSAWQLEWCGGNHHSRRRCFGALSVSARVPIPFCIPQPRVLRQEASSSGFQATWVPLGSRQGNSVEDLLLRQST